MTVTLTRLDLSDDLNVQDCRASLFSALDIYPGGLEMRTVRLANWAEKWGEAAIAALENMTHSEDVEAAQKEATEFEDKYDHLALAVREAVDDIDKAISADDVPGATFDAVNKITSILENEI